MKIKYMPPSGMARLPLEGFTPQGSRGTPNQELGIKRLRFGPRSYQQCL